MNAIPVFEAKNRLSYYLHLTDEQGPIFITNHGKPAYVIQNLKDFTELQSHIKKEKTIYECVQEIRAKYGIDKNDDFDFEQHLESLRMEEPQESARESEYIEELMQDE
ncbi:type II toxin-antitoxin system prevent-host-death family antitoxin [Treponema sp.]|uniref:type II toxin-antitoxin system prevent-host-death family antitoxin n=1 Tax=Treponema sp. TaxID=166 RepID=UPI00388ED903